MRHAAVVGAGTMGFGIALRLAAAGHDTVLVGRTQASLGRARTAIAAAVGVLAEEGALSRDAAARALGGVRTAVDLGAVADADWVVEAIPERLSDKQALFTALDGIAGPDAVLTSTTSTLSMRDIAAGMRSPGRVALTHFVNPPHIVPLVEVIGHPATPETAVARLMEDLRAAGWSPVRLGREVPGHLVNRMQMALVREALALIEEGAADARAIDTAMRDGLGPRWAVLGPLETADFGGLAVWRTVIDLIAPHLANGTPTAVLDRMVQAGRLGVRAGRGFHAYEGDDPEALVADRDRRLLRVLAARQRDAGPR